VVYGVMIDGTSKRVTSTAAGWCTNGAQRSKTGKLYLMNKLLEQSMDVKQCVSNSSLATPCSALGDAASARGFKPRPQRERQLPADCISQQCTSGRGEQSNTIQPSAEDREHHAIAIVEPCFFSTDLTNSPSGPYAQAYGEHLMLYCGHIVLNFMLM
jgi:hypothetical protein